MNLTHVVAGYLDSREYPSVLFKFPRLARLVQFVNRVTTLRNWYVSRELRRLVAKLPQGFKMMDAGCGLGDFSNLVARMRPDARILGVDFGPESVRLAALLAQDQALTNVKFEIEDLVRLKKPNQFDFILCNAVLQSVQEDGRVMGNLYEALRPGGNILLYVAVNYKRYLTGFDRLEEKYLSGCFYRYSKGFGPHRHSSDEVRSKLISNGFQIVNESTAYGFAGAVAFELYSLLLICIRILPAWVMAVLIPLYIILLLPIQLLLMLIDFTTSRANGNGFLVVARKV